MKKQQIQSISKTAIWLLFVSMVSCDSFQEDLIKNKNQITFNNTEYYLIPKTSVVVDLKSIIKESFIDATIRISQKPQHGELLMLDSTVVRYQPSSSFLKGSDEFLLSVFENGNLLKEQAIVIHMQQSYDEFPCSLYAIEDLRTAKPDSEIVIKPLDNDLICGLDNSRLASTVYKHPDHGDVLIDGDIVRYKADSGYEGWDLFVYKIISKTNAGAEIFSYGLIKVIVSEEQLHMSIDSEPIDIKIELSWEPDNSCELDLALVVFENNNELERSANPGPIHEVINSWLVDDGDYTIQMLWNQIGPVDNTSSWSLTITTAEGTLNDPDELLTGSTKSMSKTYDWFPPPGSTPGMSQVRVQKKGRTLKLEGF